MACILLMFYRSLEDSKHELVGLPSHVWSMGMYVALSISS